MIDEDWIINYEEENGLQDMYNLQNVKNISIVCIYLENHNIFKIKTENYQLEHNTLTVKDMVSFLIKNKSLNKENYYVKNVISYNFTLDNIDNFSVNNATLYLEEKTIRKPIHFQNSIKFFENLNSIYFIFQKKAKSNKNTKKIYFTTKNKTRRNNINI